MKSLGSVFGLFSFLLFSCFSLAVAQPTNNWLKPRKASSAWSTTIEKLNRIHLPQVRFENVSLGEVIRQLNDMAKQYDPDKTSIVISASTNSVAGSTEEVSSVAVNIHSLTDVRLADVLDAIVLVAAKPIKYRVELDGSVVFFARPTSPQLYSRTFIVYPEMFVFETNQTLNSTVKFSEVNQAATVTTNASRFIASLGIDLKSPPGKSVFYNDRLSRLFVKATEADLDVIERAISQLQSTQPSVHIKARFIEIPKVTSDIWRNEITASNVIIQVPVSTWQSVGDNTNFTAVTTNACSWWISLLSDRRATVWLKYLESQDNLEWLAEPETTVLSRQATQLRATEIRSLIPEKSYISGPSNVESNSPHFETGPILDVIIRVLPDGHTINALVKPTVIEFANDPKKAGLITTNNTRSQTPQLMQNWQATAKVALWDCQTVVIGGLPVPASHIERRLAPSERRLWIFITMSIVDNAGNRVHSDDSSDGIPPQPPQSK